MSHLDTVDFVFLLMTPSSFAFCDFQNSHPLFTSKEPLSVRLSWVEGENDEDLVLAALSPREGPQGLHSLTEDTGEGEIGSEEYQGKFILPPHK